MSSTATAVEGGVVDSGVIKPVHPDAVKLYEWMRPYPKGTLVTHSNFERFLGRSCRSTDYPKESDGYKRLMTAIHLLLARDDHVWISVVGVGYQRVADRDLRTCGAKHRKAAHRQIRRGSAKMATVDYGELTVRERERHDLETRRLELARLFTGTQTLKPVEPVLKSNVDLKNAVKMLGKCMGGTSNEPWDRPE